MALREVLARFGIKVDGADKLKETAKGVDALKDGLKTLGLTLGVGAIAKKIQSITSEVLTHGDALDKSARRLGTNTDSLQRWQFALSQSGGTAEELEMALKALSKKMVEVEAGSGAAADIFKKLNVDVKDSNGQFKDTTSLLEELGLALNGVENNSEKLAFAQILLEESGAKLLPLFDGGAEGIAKLNKEFAKFGGGLSSDVVLAAANAKDAIGRFDLALLGLKSRLAVAVLPTFEKMATGVASIIARVSKLLEGTNFLKAGLTIAGGVGVKAFLKMAKSLKPLLKPLAIAAAKTVILTLALDDLLSFFEGKDSVIGRFVNQIFGAGTAQKVAWRATDVWTKLLEGDFQGALESAADGLETMGGEIVKFFSGENQSVMHSWFAEFGESIVAWTVETAGMFKTFFIVVWNDFVDWLKGIGTRIKAGAIELVQDAVQLANDIVVGITKALERGAKAIKDAIVQPFKDGFKAAKNAIESKSPSKLFMRLAATIPEGAAKGIQENAFMVDEAAQRMMARTAVFGAPNITQTNNTNITIPGTGDPRSVAGNVGLAIGRRTRGGLDQALNSLVATA